MSYKRITTINFFLRNRRQLNLTTSEVSNLIKEIRFIKRKIAILEQINWLEDLEKKSKRKEIIIKRKNYWKNKYKTLSNESTT